MVIEMEYITLIVDRVTSDDNTEKNETRMHRPFFSKPVTLIFDLD